MILLTYKNKEYKMKKYNIIYLITIFVFLLTGCKTKEKSLETIFNEMKILRSENDSYLIKSKTTLSIDGQTIVFTKDYFIENNLEYEIMYDKGKIIGKNYYERTKNGTNQYLYDFDTGVWTKSNFDFDSDIGIGEVNFWNFNNYDYDESTGSFNLKKHLCVNDLISRSIIPINDQSYKIIVKYYIRVDGAVWTRTDEETFSRFGETFNLTLPKKFTTK